MALKVKVKRSLKSVISDLPSPLRSFLSLFFVTLMLVGLGVGVVALKNSQEMKVGAQGAVLSLLGPVDNIIPDPGQQFSVDIYVDTQGLKVSAADLKIKYDPNVMEGVSVESADFLPVVLVPGKVDNSTGMASITLGANPSDPVSGNAVVAKLKLKPKTKTPTTISVDNSSAVAAIGSEGNVISQFGSLNLGLPTSTPVTTPTVAATPHNTATPSSLPTMVPTPKPSPSPTPISNQLGVEQIVANKSYVILIGRNLGGVGNKVLVSIKYRYRSEGGRKWWEDLISSGWQWFTYEGMHTVIGEGEREAIYISSASLPNFNTNQKISKYEIKITTGVVPTPLPTVKSTVKPRPIPAPTRRPIWQRLFSRDRD